jgi:DNA-directed RNA polymerase specialized sigma24 family protein
MSLLARLAPHLPYIRRYARALTGDQNTGDHYVRVALEALAAGERSLDADLSPRVALYRVFHAIWLSPALNSRPVVTTASPPPTTPRSV